MTTQPVLLPSANTDVLFDDRALLETAFGKAAFNVSSANANCDCIGYTTPYNENIHSDQVIPVAA